MPKQDKNKTQPRILYSCYSQTSKEGEQFIGQHIFGYIMSGSSELYLNGKTYIFKKGDFRFLRKNQLAKFTKHPPAGGEFKTISVGIDDETLRCLSSGYNEDIQETYSGESALYLKSNSLFTTYINSLGPYIDGGIEDNKILTGLKVKEAVIILLQTNPELKSILFDFTEPGKIDLQAYMNENYKFNVDVSRFAYLTGRSLATFKRDFEKIFNTSPNKWLQQKRLDDAYYLLKEKGWKISDVYMEVGFKDFSHFSFAFKKAFGIAPSKLKLTA